MIKSPKFLIKDSDNSALGLGDCDGAETCLVSFCGEFVMVSWPGKGSVAPLIIGFSVNLPPPSLKHSKTFCKHPSPELLKMVVML